MGTPTSLYYLLLKTAIHTPLEGVISFIEVGKGILGFSIIRSTVPPWQRQSLYAFQHQGEGGPCVRSGIVPKPLWEGMSPWDVYRDLDTCGV